MDPVCPISIYLSFFNPSIILDHVCLEVKRHSFTPKHHGVCCFVLCAEPILFLYYQLCFTVSRQPVTALVGEFIQGSCFSVFPWRQ